MTVQKAPGSTQLDRIIEVANDLKARLGGDGPFSLCEAGLNEQDYESFHRWIGKSLSPRSIRFGRWEVGAVVFHFIAETARRKAREGSLWSSVREEFPPDIRSLLFLQGQPLPRLKDLIEAAVEELNLRHVLGRDDTHKWYVTTYLQFGFTQQGMLAHLPQWLSGAGMTTAIELLLSGTLASETFRDLWQALRYYRRDLTTETQARSVIVANRWVLSAWQNDLVALAREHAADSASADLFDDVENAPNILGPPRIQWAPDKEPRFNADIQDLKPLRLFEPHYDLVAGDLPLARVFRQPDGDYRPDCVTVTLPCTSPDLAVRLVDPNKDTFCAQFVQLWDPSSEVNAFDLRTGLRIDEPVEKSLHGSGSYVLLTSPDITACPELDWVRMGGGASRTAMLVEAPWQPERLSLSSREGGMVWRPTVAARNRVPEPSWAGCITVEITGRRRVVRVGETVELVVHRMPPKMTLAYARAAGRAIEFDPTTGKLEAISISPDVAQRGLHVRLGVRAQSADAAVIDIRRQVNVAIAGAVELAPDGWVKLDARRTRTVQSCRERAFRVYLPPHCERAVVMEGPLHVGWVGRRASPLANVVGTGAPLMVRERPFNCDGDLLSLAIGVIDGGIVRETRTDASVAGGFDLILSRPVLPGADHGLLFWSTGGEPEFAPLTQLDVTASEEGRRWRFQRTPADEEPTAAIVAVAYKGRLIGSAWNGDLARFFAGLAEQPAGSRLLAAALLRWCEAPVLLKDRAERKMMFADFAHAHPEAVFAGWLTGDGLPQPLLLNTSFQRSQVEWSQLRALYCDWTPTVEQAVAIVEVLAPQNGDNRLFDALLRLALELPELSARLALCWVRRNGPPCPRARLPLYFQVLRQHLGLADRQGRPKDADELLRLAANSLRVDANQTADEFFVKDIADIALDAAGGHWGSEMQVANYLVASQVASFRQYLGLRVLDALEKEFNRL